MRLIPSAQGESGTCALALSVCSQPHTIKIDIIPSGHIFNILAIRKSPHKGPSQSQSLLLSREVKPHRAEGNGHIACNSTRGGMSVARGHCRERRVERSLSSCIRPTSRSQPQVRASPSVGRGKSLKYSLLLQQSCDVFSVEKKTD